MHDETSIRLYDRRIEKGKITVKPIYHNLARCNVCGISANSEQLYKIILDNETGKAFSVHNIELCKPCMNTLAKTLLKSSKE